MNGIIDTDDDVTLLRKRGVVINRMKKSDGEAAKPSERNAKPILQPSR